MTLNGIVELKIKRVDYIKLSLVKSIPPPQFFNIYTHC